MLGDFCRYIEYLRGLGHLSVLSILVLVDFSILRQVAYELVGNPIRFVIRITDLLSFHNNL